MIQARHRTCRQAVASPRAWRAGVASAAALILLAAGSPPAAGAGSEATDEAQRIYQQSRESVYQVRVVDLASGKKRSIGSGFRISEEGHVATNFHVISSAVLSPERYRVELIRREDVLGVLEILDVDVVHDLAVAAVTGAPPPGPALALGRSDLEKGQRLFSLGNPHDIGMTVVEGTYNGLKERSMYRRILFTGSLNPGMSGGPALDREGRVVGINVATAGNQVSFLVPVEHLRDLLGRAVEQGETGEDWDARIESQLLANQDYFMSEMLSGEWPLQPIGRAEVPGEVLDTFSCWGESHDVEHDLYRHTDIWCSSEEAIYLSQYQRTGRIALTYRWMETDALNPLRFYALMEETFQSEGSFGTAGEEDVSNFLCREAFLEMAGGRWKLARCARRYLRYPALYDTFLAAASLDGTRSGLLAWVSVMGVSRENADLFTARFLEEIRWED